MSSFDSAAAEQPADPVSALSLHIPRRHMDDVTIVAEGLQFPEGPVALSDGDLLVGEVRRGTVSRVRANGAIEPIASCGGGPSGVAVGPDGAIYVCNNGGRDGRGRIERIDPDTGEVIVLYAECDGRPLNAPNDLVFDRTGNFWFTDSGIRREYELDLGWVGYASPTGDRIQRVIGDLDFANGVGLAPSEEFLYVAETRRSRLHRRRVIAPGTLEPSVGLDPVTLGRQGRIDMESLLVGMPGYQPFDSLAVDSEGYIGVGTLGSGCVTVISPDGSSIEQLVPPSGLEDDLITNICFGGPEMRTAFVTFSRTGRLVACRWPRPGLPLAFGR
jgi:gluconolactonase